MQFNLPDPFAPNISGQFYNYLAHGHAVPEAARQARRAVKRENEFFVGMIALYAAHPDEVGTLRQAQGAWRGAGAQTVSLFRPADVSDLPTPASGLIGRQRELMRIGTRLLEDKKPLTVTLHGAGGIGKTALLREALLRFAPSFELTLAIGLDTLPSLESVLGRIERFLGLPSPCSNDTKEREALVRNALTSKRTLLGLDNFETLNYALNEKGSDEEKTAKSLHTFFKSLAANGVTLCVTSREVTNLGGEIVEDIQGLTNESGGRLFQENVVKQKDQIYIEKTQQVSEMVGGHPLALRLLASAFDDQVGTSLDQYIEDLQSFLPKARDKWTEEDRHESLRASFDFTMNNLVKTEEGKELQIALSRLSVFTAFFAPSVVAPTLAGKWYENEDEDEAQQDYAQKITFILWEHGLLERQVITIRDEDINLYRLHPALNLFAANRLTTEDLPTVQEMHWRALCQLASRSYPTSEGGGIYGNPFLSIIARAALPDMLKATKFRKDKETSNLLFNLAFLETHYGDLDGAMQSYKQALQIRDSLGDLIGKAAILHDMAGILITRGKFDRAMKLYQDAQKIYEGVGNKKGKAATVQGMAVIFSTRGDLDGAMQLYQQALQIQEGLGDLRGISAVLNNMAQIYITRGNLDEAMRLYRRALVFQESLSDLKGKASILHNMAVILASRGDLDEAIQLYQQAHEISEGLDDLKGKAMILHNMSQIYITRGNFDDAMRLLQQVLRIQESQGYLLDTVATLHNMAGILFRRGDMDGAIQLLQQSLQISEGLGNLRSQSSSLTNMAGIYITRNDLERAMQLCQQALQIQEHLGDLQGRAATLNNMAMIYVKRGDLDTAMQLCQQSLKLKEDLGDLEGKAETLNNMGIVLFRNNQFVTALRYFVEAKNIYERIGASPGAQTVNNVLIKFRKQLGVEKFDALWREEIGQSIPEWIKQQSQQEQ
jgi:tetratricopeptide (TPR) repeat protein